MGEGEFSVKFVHHRRHPGPLRRSNSKAVTRGGARRRALSEFLRMMCGCVVPEDKFPPVKTKIRQSRRVCQMGMVRCSVQ